MSVAAQNPAGSRRRSPATVSVGFANGLLSGLRARGLEAGPLLKDAGITAARLTDPAARVPLAAYATLYNVVVRFLDDEGFALFSRPLRCGTFEFLCRSMIGSRSLGEGLQRAARFLALVVPDVTLSVTRDDHAAWLEIGEVIPIGTGLSDARRVFAFEWLLRLVHGLSGWMVGRGLSLDTVTFPYPRPSHAADYALIYTEQAHFDGDRLAARLRANLLDLPLVRDSEAVNAFLEGAPGKITMLYRRDREMVRRVRDMMAAAFPEPPPPLETLAARLHLSPRTVQRRLEHEGSSYRAVKSALRRDVALARLEKSTRSIADIALELGYTETSTFFRAFVEWTGEAPTTYRKRIQG